jgi:phage terminase small subunit
MKGGQNALSPKLLRMRGTARPDRHGGYEAPETIQGDPQAPNELTGEAKAEWDRMVVRLTLTGAIELVSDKLIYHCALLTAEIEGTRARYEDDARLDARLTALLNQPDLETAQMLEILGPLNDCRKRLLSASTTLRQGHMAMRQFLTEFGLTPASRGRVKLPVKHAKVDAEKAKYA